MAKTIEVIVSTDGAIKIDAVGFKGADCERATAFLEKALGTASGRQKKPEYHGKAQAQQRLGA